MFANDRYPTDFIIRAEFVKQCLVDKYKKALNQPVWYEDELETLPEHLKEEINEWQKRKTRARKRIVWSAMLYIAYIDHTNVFVPQFASLDTIEWKLGGNSLDLKSSKNNYLKRAKPRATVYQPLAEQAMIKRYMETGDTKILLAWTALYGDKYP